VTPSDGPAWTPPGSNPKRRVDEQTLLLGQDVVPVNEALAAVLRRVLDETTRQLGGDQPDELRLTHPAEWGPLRRNVLLTAGRLAGFCFDRVAAGRLLRADGPARHVAHLRPRMFHSARRATTSAATRTAIEATVSAVEVMPPR
jgi:hypothetical protein